MEAEQNTFKFLQLSDLRLDSPQNRRFMCYSEVQRQERYQMLLDSFVSTLSLASEFQVDAVLIPGGLWDHRTVRRETARSVIDAIGSLGNIPVVIAPGPSDALLPDSFYSNLFLEASGLGRWPSNAVIFRSAILTDISHPKRPEITFTGFAHSTLEPRADRFLGKPFEELEGGFGPSFRVLVFSGTLEREPGMPMVNIPGSPAPFTASELETSAFCYAALGGLKDLMQVESRDGRILGAYSGSLIGSDPDEAGPRACLLGSVTFDDKGMPDVYLEPMESQQARIIHLPLDITALDEESLSAEISAKLEEEGVRPAQDVVLLSLEGDLNPGCDTEKVLEEFKKRLAYLVISNRSRIDYLSRDLSSTSIEGRFLEAMLQKHRSAEAESATERARIAQDALFYGLDALTGRKVKVRHVD